MKEALREVGMIARCFESIANIEFKEYNLAKNQYIYLVRICETPGIILERLIDLVKVDRSTASRAVEKLCKLGFVQKVRSQDNQKNNCLFPTAKGQEIYHLLERDETYSNQVALQGFTQEELDLLLSMLLRIRKNIEPDWELVKSGGKRAYAK